jgi:hypothetical protein
MAASNVRSAVVALTALVAVRPAQASESVSIWYRTADGCPTAAAFLERLSTHGLTATLARAGDRIDFVVTLGLDERGSAGSLERQSAEGTVAIRQVEAASCEAVADALALTLALSADPDTAATSSTPAAPPVLAGAESAPPPAASSTPPNAAAAPAQDRAPPVHDASERSPWQPSFGIHGSIATLAKGSPLFGGNVFVDLAYDRGLRPHGRAGFVAGFAAPTDDLSLQVLLGRLAACPLTLGGALSFEPCLALDLGSLQARNSAAGGHADSAFWSAAWALARGAYAPAPGWALELEGGASVPLTPYEIEGGEPRSVLAETAPVTFSLALGVRFGWK